MIADHKNPQSIAAQMRRQRFSLFLSTIAGIASPVSILDVGGAEGYWLRMAGDSGLLDRAKITLLNLEQHSTGHPAFTSVAGDARNLSQYATGQFDVVFSNSTIEHVGAWPDQQRMASEVRRVGRRYYVQTPNRYFPIEPHFLFPFFQFLPVGVRARLLQRFRLGWMRREPEYPSALATVKQIRLLSGGEIQVLFPGATIHRERFVGLAKSFVVIGVG